MENNLRIILAMKGHSISSLAREADISRTVLSDFYHERNSNPELKTLLKICNYLNVSLDELLGFKEITIKKQEA